MSSVRRGQQYAALPITEVEGRIRVLLVTSRETRRWVIPKGWAEESLAPSALAAKEAFEEAGAIGEVSLKPIGNFSYSKRLKDGSRLICQVGVFQMMVVHLLEDWPERRERERKWFMPADAAKLVAEAGLADLLRTLVPATSDS